MLNDIIIGEYDGQRYAFFTHNQQTIYRASDGMSAFAPPTPYIYTHRFGPYSGDIYKNYNGYDDADNIGGFKYIHTDIEGDEKLLWEMLEDYISPESDFRFSDKDPKRYVGAAVYFSRSRKIDSVCQSS